MQTSVHLYPAHIKVGAVRRDLQKMLGEAQWTMACPRVPALLLLVVGELGMLWGEKNSMKRRKSPRNRLGMVPIGGSEAGAEWRHAPKI